MPMSSGGHVASSSGCATRPKAEEIGLTGYAEPTRHSSPIGRYVMATAEHREPCDSRGSCTVLGAPGGEIPPGDSTTAAVLGPNEIVSLTPASRLPATSNQSSLKWQGRRSCALAKASASPQQADYLPSNPSSLQRLGWHSASAVSRSEASGLWSARRSIPEHQKFVDHQMESSPFRRGRPDHTAVKE